MRSSAENRIARASATLSASEVRIPCLQEERLVPRYDIFKLSQLGPAEAAGACEHDRTNPEFRKPSFPRHVNMWWLVAFVAEKEEPIRSNDLDGRHSCLPLHSRVAFEYVMADSWPSKGSPPEPGRSSRTIAGNKAPPSPDGTAGVLPGLHSSCFQLMLFAPKAVRPPLDDPDLRVHAMWARCDTMPSGERGLPWRRLLPSMRGRSRN